MAWHGVHAASGKVCSRTTRTRVSSAEKKRAEIDVNTVIPHRLSRTASRHNIYKATLVLPFTTSPLLPSVQTTQLRRPSPPTVPPARLPSTSERTHTHIDPRERKTRTMPPSADRGPSPLRPPTTPFRLDSQMSPIDKDLHPVIHSGRVAVVTGAASGIGAAAAREFAKFVFHLFFRSSTRLSALPYLFLIWIREYGVFHVYLDWA